MVLGVVVSLTLVALVVSEVSVASAGLAALGEKEEGGRRRRGGEGPSSSPIMSSPAKRMRQ